MASATNGYASFVDSKRPTVDPVGVEVAEGDVHSLLFPWQRRIVTWAAHRGRAAIFADCGLGKTLIQLEWARLMREHSGRPVLILAPLAVSGQTCEEAGKIDLDGVEYRRDGSVCPITVTNYEMLKEFRPEDFGAVVLDESSILKAYDGITRGRITDWAAKVPMRLACTATPAPNDIIEVSNHAEFLGVMREREVRALFFVQDGNTTTKYRLRGHARGDFFRWLAEWAVACRKPSDLGDEDDGFVLPDLTVLEEVVGEPEPLPGELFARDASTLSERRAARRISMHARVDHVAGLVNGEPDEPWLVWCDLNAESAALAAAIPGAVEVKGADSLDHKEAALAAFSRGDIRVLVTKPSIAGWGMNWQHCARVAFTGLSDSYEQFYQAVRRCWRFGQSRPVRVHVVIGPQEGAVLKNIQRKERQASEMFELLVNEMTCRHEAARVARRNEMTYEEAKREGGAWTMDLGDCCERIADVEDDSVGLSVFSPPFPGMYAYTNSARDVGNSSSMEELVQHFGFLIPELLRVTLPGRHCAVHLTQYVAQKGRDGYIGLRDFRGETIRLFEAHGWIYYGEVTIDKNPQVKAIRTKDRGLLFKTLAKDASHMHMALPDTILQFRKPGENADPIRAGISERYDNLDGWISAEEWIRWARPVWYGQDWAPDGDGIAETDVLNVRVARESDDERHICPLQLGVIERCVKLWSNPGDLVLSPFAGIGSEGVVAVQFGRRFHGIELKRKYWETACRNLASTEAEGGGLFSSSEEGVA
jgi:superfamily II DNA or RNA helicase